MSVQERIFNELKENGAEISVNTLEQICDGVSMMPDKKAKKAGTTLYLNAKQLGATIVYNVLVDAVDRETALSAIVAELGLEDSDKSSASEIAGRYVDAGVRSLGKAGIGWLRRPSGGSDNPFGAEVNEDDLLAKFAKTTPAPSGKRK